MPWMQPPPTPRERFDAATEDAEYLAGTLAPLLGQLPYPPGSEPLLRRMSTVLAVAPRYLHHPALRAAISEMLDSYAAWENQQRPEIIAAKTRPPPQNP